MEEVIDFEYLKGRQNEIIVKELSVASRNVTDSFRFKSPYSMATHGSDENGLNWDDGHINYHELFTVVSEAVAGFAHFYSYGITKCKLLAELLGRQFLTCRILTVLNLRLSIINACAAFLVINFTISIAQPKPHIPSMIG